MKKNKLALCVALASIGVTPVFADAVENNTLETDKITVVGKDTDKATLALEHEADVSKLGVSIFELPFSVSVVDKDFIEATGAKNIQDALLYTPGVYAGNFGNDTRGDWVKIRGADPVKYLDGLKSHYGHYNNVRVNTYALEHIEVLKGPASVLYGQSTIGGILNSVSKLPQEEESGELWAQIGTENRKQLAGDWTGKVDDEGKVLVRFVGLARNSDTQVDHVEDDEYLFSPSLTWRPNENTQLTMLANFQKAYGAVSAQFLPSYGTILPGVQGPIDPSTFVGEPGWDRYDREQQALTVKLDHRFNDIWSFSTTARYVDSATETREHWVDIGIVPAANGDVTRTLYSIDRDFQALNIDARLKAEFGLGMTEHKVLIGIDSQDTEIDESNYFYQRGAGGTINLYNPVYGVTVPGTLATTDRPWAATDQVGVYLADHITIGNTIVSAAIRHDETTNETEGSATKAKSDATTGQLGLMYQFENGVSPYISYAESFEPNTGTDGMGNLLKPTEGEQTEVGFKYLSNDKDTSLTVAWFDIEQTDRVAAGSTPGGLRQVGAAIDGWELELQQKWDSLKLRLNLTDLNAEDGSGGRLPYVAERLVSAWADYDFGNGWRTGLGARYTGDNVGWGGSPVVPSVTQYDAMVGYETGDWDFSLVVKNLTDETYVSWCRSAGTDCGYGEELTAQFNTRYKF